MVRTPWLLCKRRRQQGCHHHKPMQKCGRSPWCTSGALVKGRKGWQGVGKGGDAAWGRVLTSRGIAMGRPAQQAGASVNCSSSSSRARSGRLTSRAARCPCRLGTACARPAAEAAKGQELSSLVATAPQHQQAASAERAPQHAHARMPPHYTSAPHTLLLLLLTCRSAFTFARLAVPRKAITTCIAGPAGQAQIAQQARAYDAQAQMCLQ